MEVTTLKDYVFNKASISKKIIQSYKSLISNDFKERIGSNMQITSEYIHLTLKIPFYIATKIYSAFASNSKASVDEFISKYETMFLGGIKERIEILFNIFDFNKDGVIKAEDIVFFLKKFFVVKYKREYYNTFKRIIKEMRIKNSLTKDTFVNYITNENSDVFYLFFLFMQESNLYKEKYITYYCNNGKGIQASSNTIEVDKTFGIKEPSLLMLQFAQEVICFETEVNLTPDEEEEETDEEELRALDAFEEALSSCMSPLNKLRPISFISDKTLVTLRHNSDDNNKPFKPISLDKKTNSNSTKEISLLSFQSISTIHSDTAIKYSHSLQKEGITINMKSNDSPKKTIIIIDKLIFIKKRSRNRKEEDAIESIVSLNNYYTSPIIESLSKKKKGVNYKTELLSITSGYTKAIMFYSTKREKLEALIALINKKTNYRTIVDYYHQDNLIAKGNYGEIYQATSIYTNSKVAIKKISKAGLESSAFWEREVFSILKLYPHHNIISCIDSFETSQEIYLIFEYSGLGTLRSLIQDKEDISEEQQIAFLDQLILAVSYLHKKGIVHRDIKPDNLLISRAKGKYSLKLTDFGLCKILSPNETTNESYGSLVYSSPEVIMGTHYSFQPDIWSIGMMTYFIYSCLDPFATVDGDMDHIRDMITSLNVNFLYRNLTNKDMVIKLMKRCLKGENRPTIKFLYSK